MDQDANVNERDIEHGPEWKVSIAPELLRTYAGLYWNEA